MRNKVLLLILLVIVIALPGCGIVNNLNATRKNLATNILPHPYRFDEIERQSVLDSGQGIVSLNVQPNVKTVWKKVNDDGSIGKEDFTLTYATDQSAGRRESRLEPGIYLLNGYSFSEGGVFYRAGSERNTLSSEAFGWDSENKQAKCFSFILKAGEELFIPDLTILPAQANKNSMCARIRIDGPTSDLYKIGPESM